MAQLRRDASEDGVVYVEFLLAFMPVFVLFLAICQLCLIGTAGTVVRHAAYAAARSAIVVLEDSPEEYDGAPRGSLSAGVPRGEAGLDALLSSLAVTDASSFLSPAPEPLDGAAGTSEGAPPAQQGARMLPIRTAAYAPLLVLAPMADAAGTGATSLAGSLPSGLVSQLGAALLYTRAAAVVTVHVAGGADELAREPIGRTAPITLRVSYLYQCDVPLVRALMCRSLASLLANDEPESTAGQRAAKLVERLKLAELPGVLANVVAPGARFYPLTGEVTLPNQGAAYEHPEEG